MRVAVHELDAPRWRVRVRENAPPEAVAFVEAEAAVVPQRTIATAADATRAAQDALCNKASGELVPDIAACVKAFLTDARRWFAACDGDCWSPESARRAGIGGAVNQSAARLHTAIMERLVRAIGVARVEAFTQGIAATRISSAAVVPERVVTGQVVKLREAGQTAPESA